MIFAALLTGPCHSPVDPDPNHPGSHPELLVVEAASVGDALDRIRQCHAAPATMLWALRVSAAWTGEQADVNAAPAPEEARNG